MRFSCGKTWEAKKARKAKWHKYFVWFPISFRIEGESKYRCVWLEYVERRGQFASYWGDSGWEWEYRLIDKS